MQKYIGWVLDLRKRKLLHTRVENQLKLIISKILPDYLPISEVQGLAGGRNDLTLFEYSGKKVLFEIFATRSQVSRDLRILDKTEADVKIAIIIDKEADKRVFEKFIRENPEDNYPYLFIHELFIPDKLHDTFLKIFELIKQDDKARIYRYLKKRYSKEAFAKFFSDEKIQFLTQKDINSEKISIGKVFITLILCKLLKLGIKKEKLVDLGKALSTQDVLEFQITRMLMGFSIFIYTDLDGNLGFYSNNELQDFLHIGHEFSEPRILLSLNATLKELVEKYYKGTELSFQNEIFFTSGISSIVRNSDGNDVTVSIPKNTQQISIILPMNERNKERKDFETCIEKYRKMISII